MEQGLKAYPMVIPKMFRNPIRMGRQCYQVFCRVYRPTDTIFYSTGIQSKNEHKRNCTLYEFFWYCEMKKNCDELYIKFLNTRKTTNGPPHKVLGTETKYFWQNIFLEEIIRDALYRVMTTAQT